MASARETAERHANDVIAGNMGQVVADFTPEAMSEFQKHAAMPPRPTKTAEILNSNQEGDKQVFEIKYANDAESLTIRSWWQDENGTWKIVKAEPVR